MLSLSDRARKTNAASISCSQFTQMLDRRLSIAQMGLAEARQHLAAGQTADAGIVLDKLDEDLLLLRCRVDREAKVVAPRPTSLRESAN